MWRYIFIVLLFITSSVFAQTKLKGRVFENKTRIGLPGIQVDNLNNKETTLTDNNGSFALSAKAGDLLIIKGFAFKTDTLLVTDLHEKEIFLEPVTHELDQVNITTTETKNVNTYYDPQFHGQPVVYARNDDMSYKGGIIWRIWYWKKDKKKRDKLAALEKKYAITDKIYAVFRPEIIVQYLPLTGDDINNFINLYTPSPEVCTAKDFNLTAYLNSCYKKYQALLPDKRHPPKLKN